jgi:hypothetical protein
VPSSSDDATSSPDDAVLTSSEKGDKEASKCMTNEVAMIGRSQDNAWLLASPRPFLETYWDSPEAKLLFRPLASASTALVAIDNQIKALRNVNKSSNAFLTVAGNLDKLNEDDVTEHQKWVIQQKAQYLALALHLVRDERVDMAKMLWENDWWITKARIDTCLLPWDRIQVVP